MVKLTQSLTVWLYNNHPDVVALITLGHTELFTEEMAAAYIDWLKTDDGKQYLEGGSKYNQQVIKPKEAYYAPYKIIATDFDGTLFTDGYPGVGEPIWATINRLKEEQANGAKAILWTNREGDELRTAVNTCKHYGIHFDAVNDNLPDIIKNFGSNPRKVFANEYWDDRMKILPHLKHPDGANDKLLQNLEPPYAHSIKR